MSQRFLNFTANQTLPAASLNTNFQEAEDSFIDVGPFVISGLTLSAGTGLSCAVAAGVALLGGRLTFAGGAASGLTPSTTNHIFLNLDGTLSSNTTGTAPANSCKLGTCATSGVAVTSVDTSVTSGRQQKGTDAARTIGTLTVGTITGSGNQTLTKAPDVTPNYGVLSVGNGGFSGSAGHYAGGANGSLIAVNLASGGSADLLNLQINGVSKWKLGSGGNVTLGEGTNMVLGTSTGNKIGSATTQKLGFFNATPVIQPVSNEDIRTSLLNLGLIAGGVNGLNLNGGDLTANQGIFSGALQGSGTALVFKRLSYTFPTDGNQTLSTSDKANVIIDIQAAGVITAQRDLLVSGNAGAFYIVINREGFGVNVRVGANTGIVVASHRSRILTAPGGTTMFALTSDTDYSV